MKLKSAYIFNFSKYVSWPATAKQVQVCMQGNDALIGFMKDLVQGRQVGQPPRPIEVRSLVSGEANQDCDIAFVQQDLPKDYFTSPNTLIVASERSVKQSRPALIFFEENNKLRFEVDLEALHDSQRQISSELLKLAKIK